MTEIKKNEWIFSSKNSWFWHSYYYYEWIHKTESIKAQATDACSFRSSPQNSMQCCWATGALSGSEFWGFHYYFLPKNPTSKLRACLHRQDWPLGGERRVTLKSPAIKNKRYLILKTSISKSTSFSQVALQGMFCCAMVSTSHFLRIEPYSWAWFW